MPDSTIELAVAGTYLALSLVVGAWPSRRSSESAAGFVAGDRRVGFLLMYFITGASIFSAFAFLGLPGWTLTRGAAAFYILAYGALGLLPFYFLGPRASRVGLGYGIVTQAELVAKRFDRPAIALAMAVVSLVAFVPYLALQIKGAGYVLHAMSAGGVPIAVGGAVVYGVVLTYVLRSGVLGVGWTNTFQGVFMMALAWGLGLYLPNLLHGGVSAMFDQLAEQRPDLLALPGLDSRGQSWGSAEFGSAVLVSTIGLSFWPHLFMKAFTARDERTIRRTVVWYPTFSIFLVPLFLIGYCGVLFPTQPASADQILPHMLMNLELPSLLVGLFCAGALAASMSSGDAMAHAAGSIAVRDGYCVALRRPLSDRTEARWMKASTVGVVVVSYVVAVLYQGSLVELLLIAYGGIVQFAPAMTAALYWSRARGSAVLGGLLMGTAVTAVFVVWPTARPWPVHPGVYGLIANVVVLVLGSIGNSSTEGERLLATAGRAN